ncbi:hypothetical protein ACEWWX_004595 [Salmonella enterica]
MAVQTENAVDVTDMERDHFMEEVRHRASLLSVGLQPGCVIVWCSKENNLSWLYQFHALSRRFILSCFTTEDVKQFWQAFAVEPALRQLLRSMGGETRTLYRCGLGGDHYSVPVFHLVIHDFITRYFGFPREYRRPQLSATPDGGYIPLSEPRGGWG